MTTPSSRNPAVARELAQLRGEPFDAYPLLEPWATRAPAAVPIEPRPTRARCACRCAVCDGPIGAHETVRERADRALVHVHCGSVR